MTGQKPGSTFRVLVVDDDEMMAEYVSLELASLGCECTIATDGEQAVSMVQPDTAFIITDRKMPGMDGVELVKRLRGSQRSGDHIRIAMMTSRGDDAIIREALNAGVDDFLYKPIDTLQLELAVSSAKRFARLHRSLGRRNRLLTDAHGRIRESLRRVRTDIAAAAELHRRLLPHTERLPGIDLALLYLPAETIGGDTIGASNVGPGKTLFFILDVVGHGIPAALDSFHLHHRFKQMYPRTVEELEAAVSRLNSEILERDDENYATLVCGLADAQTSTASIITAGHLPPVLIENNRTTFVDAEASHPLGWFANAKYTATQIAFAQGTSIAIFSDGLAEEAATLYPSIGDQGLLDLFGDISRLPPKEVSHWLERRLAESSTLEVPKDDVSLLMLSPSDREAQIHD